MEPVEEGCVTENIMFSGWYILGCEVGVGWRRIYCLYRSGGIIVRVGRPVREKILEGTIDDNARVMRVLRVGDSEGAFPRDVVGTADGTTFVAGECGRVGVAGAVALVVGGTGVWFCTASGVEAMMEGDDVCGSARCGCGAGLEGLWGLADGWGRGALGVLTDCDGERGGWRSGCSL